MNNKFEMYNEIITEVRLNEDEKCLEMVMRNDENNKEVISIPLSVITDKSTIEEDIKNSDNYNLNIIFGWVCDEYARRLCKMYDWYFEDCFWVADNKGGTFCTSDIEYSLSMENIKLLVDNNVSFKSFDEWWEYNYRMGMAIRNNPNDETLHEVNLWSWIKGYHGDKDKEWLKKQEDLYWSKTHEEEFGDKHTQLTFTEDLKNFFEENNINVKGDEQTN